MGLGQIRVPFNPVSVVRILKQMYCKICHVRKPSAHSERLESMRWWVSVTQILLGISMYIHAIPLSMKFRYLERTTALLLRLELKVCSMLMVYRMDFLPKHFCQIYSISGLWDFIFFKFKNKTKKKKNYQDEILGFVCAHYGAFCTARISHPIQTFTVSWELVHWRNSTSLYSDKVCTAVCYSRKYWPVVNKIDVAVSVGSRNVLIWPDFVKI